MPVITATTETDLIDGNVPGYNGASVPDSDHLRVCEVPLRRMLPTIMTGEPIYRSAKMGHEAGRSEILKKAMW